VVTVGSKHKELLQQMTALQKSSLPNKVTIELCSGGSNRPQLTPSGTQLTPDMTPVPFATSDGHLLTQTAMSSNTLLRFDAQSMTSMRIAHSLGSPSSRGACTRRVITFLILEMTVLFQLGTVGPHMPWFIAFIATQLAHPVELGKASLKSCVVVHHIADTKLVTLTVRQQHNCILNGCRAIVLLCQV